MKRVSLISLWLFVAAQLWSQAPERMSYQAVIRNSSNQLVVNQQVGMYISILQGSSNGSVVYAETQSPTSNANGLVTLEIGTGNVVSGVFANVNWSNGPFFIQTETDPTGGTAYSISGVSQLLSVPYALHAKSAEQFTGTLNETDPQFNASVASGITAADITHWNDHFSGDYNDLTNTPVIPTVPTNVSAFTNDAGYLITYTETDPEFNASVAAGITAADITHWNDHFSGDYNDLTNTPVIPTVPSNVSAFTNDAGYLTTYTETDPQFNASVASGITAADITHWNNHFSGDYNDLTNTPVIPTVPSNVSAFTNDAGYLTTYTETDPEFNASPAAGITVEDIDNWNDQLSQGWNINGNSGTVNGTHFIGTTDNVPLNFKVNNQKAGTIDANSIVFLGYQAGENNTAIHNTAIGYQAFQTTSNGLSHGNTAIGYRALRANSGLGRNTAVGSNAMLNNTSGEWSTAIGHGALYTNTTGTHNTAVGGVALVDNISGGGNAAFGYGALLHNNNGNTNTAIGMYALKENNSGNSNVAMGFESGYNSKGSGNVFLGYQAGYNETGSNKLYIANSAANTPLIYGDFSTGNVGIGTNNPTERLYVVGTIGDGRIATFNNAFDEKFITVGQVLVDLGGYLKYKASANYIGIGVHGHLEPLIVNGNNKVGINNQNPLYDFDVNGDINFTGELRKNGTPLVIDGSETKINAGSNITVSGNGTTATPYIISAAKPNFHLGQDTLGGIVFYIYMGANGQQHGLIVSKTETTAQWQSSSSTTNADRSWDGAYNTSLMTNSPAKDWITANFTSEWYLPSFDELSLLWNNRFHANKGLNDAGATLLSNTNLYWSSTEYDIATAFNFYFLHGHGFTSTPNKAGTNTVRAIRSF